MKLRLTMPSSRHLVDKPLKLIGRKQICLVEHQRHRDARRLSRHQKACGIWWLEWRLFQMCKTNSVLASQTHRSLSRIEHA